MQVLPHFNFDSVALPTRDEFTRIARKFKDTATGPDGIPYSVYHSEKAADIVYDLFTDICACGVGPGGLPDAISSFVPKDVEGLASGEVDDGSTGFFRNVDEVRPIAQRNASLKICSGVAATCMAPSIS